MNLNEAKAVADKAAHRAARKIRRLRSATPLRLLDAIEFRQLAETLVAAARELETVSGKVGESVGGNSAKATPV